KRRKPDAGNSPPLRASGFGPGVGPKIARADDSNLHPSPRWIWSIGARSASAVEDAEGPEDAETISNAEIAEVAEVSRGSLRVLCELGVGNRLCALRKPSRTPPASASEVEPGADAKLARREELLGGQGGYARRSGDAKVRVERAERGLD